MRRESLVLSLLLALAMCVGACAVPQPQNTPVDQRHEYDPASGRGYWIYVPSGYRHDRPAPLIVTCHGTPPFDVSSHHVRELKMLGERYGCIVIAPELIATDGVLGDGPVVGMLDNERNILSVISSLGYRYNIDTANIMITGFSGGGFPVYWVGLRHPDIFSVVVARSSNFSGINLHGWYTPEARWQAVKVYHTQNDPGAIRDQSRRAITYLRSKGFRVETEILPGKGHERMPEVAVRFFRKHWRRSRPSLPAER